METTLHTIWTVIALALFVGIVVWAFSPTQKRSFDEASRLPLEDDAAIDSFSNAVENNK